MPCRKKVCRNPKKVGTLVRSKVRRAAVVLRINCLSTADQPRVNRTFCSPSGLHRNSFVLASEGTFRRNSLRCSGKQKRNGCFLCKLTRRPPFLPRTAPPLCRAPLRPDPPVVCPGFGFERFHDHTGSCFAPQCNEDYCHGRLGGCQPKSNSRICLA